LLRRAGKVLVRDLGSLQGTFVNGQRLQRDQELQDGDRLGIGPLHFQIRLEVGASTSLPPPSLSAHDPVQASIDEEAAAALLLALPDIAIVSPLRTPFETTGTAKGNTVPRSSALAERLGGLSDSKPTQPEVADTSAAARAILENYQRHHGRLYAARLRGHGSQGP
jgi:predicted component of type VI protein secretion system